ncbi:MAG: toxin-antitoxin system HicB family antitoxin [Acidobacteria bacterium]|nr:toxin-antitoxin system HicB family antitoxin [Acidobacteriota bacterium]
MTKTSTFPLRLPVSLKAALEKLSKEDGVSINQYVVMAVAEKISAIHTAQFFEERRALSNRREFRKILKRKGGEPPRHGDEIAED